MKKEEKKDLWMVSCNGSFAEYDSDGDTYFKQL